MELFQTIDKRHIQVSQIIGSQIYHLNTVDIEKKFLHIEILRKNSHFSGFNILPNVIHIIVLIKYLFLQFGFRC